MSGGNQPMVLKNSLAKPRAFARYAIFYGFILQMRRASQIFRLFHPDLPSAGATIPPKSGEGLASLTSRRKF